MKRLLIIAISLTLALYAIAQTQTGIVKTRGRLGNNGQVIAGKPIASATVQVRGRTAVVTKANGTFSFPIPANKFIIQSIKKQGYVLVDPEAIARQYSYSSNPLILVMETPTQQSDDRLANERKIRRQLEKKLHDREDKIEELKAQNKLTEEEYRKQLQQLYADQENNEKLIKEMAERYTQLDFDQMDEFNLRISDCILNGRLTEADSLLRTKGDINTRIEKLNKQHEANVETRDNLEKSEAMEQKDREDIAQDCYHRYELFFINHQNDSAAHYLELRANLDTTNVEWQNQTGMFIAEYLADYSTALSYSFRGLQQAILEYGEESEETATSYNNIGTIFAYNGSYSLALESFEKSLYIQEKVFGIDHPEIATSYDNIGSIFLAQDYNITAMTYFRHSLAIRENEDPDIYKSYNNIGIIYDNTGYYDTALVFLKKALDICEQTFGTLDLRTAACYHNIGSTYYHQGDYLTSIEYYGKALAIREQILGADHPNVGNSFIAFGDVYYDKGDYIEALDCYLKALSIYGKLHFTAAETYYKIANIYYVQGDYLKAKDYAYSALASCINNDLYAQWILDIIDKIIPKEEFDEYLVKVGISAKSMLEYLQQNKHHTNDVLLNVWETRKNFIEIVCMTFKEDLSTTEMDGLRGDYYLLEFNGSRIISLTVLIKEFIDSKYKDQPVDVVLMKDGVITKHHFDKLIGTSFSARNIGHEERERINQLYEEWKRENK